MAIETSPELPAADSDYANALLDTLTIELLDLIEQQVRCQLDIEDSVCRGQLNMAKTRYTLGTRSVSIAQLPTENTPEFESLVRVAGDDDEPASALEVIRRGADKAEGRPDPMRWFGVLLPQSMSEAKRMFGRAIDCSVQAVNVRRSLRDVMESVLRLRQHLAVQVQ